MKELNEAVALATALLEQTEAYTAKPTKAESARVRKTLSSLKAIVTPAKKELMEADKA